MSVIINAINPKIDDTMNALNWRARLITVSQLIVGYPFRGSRSRKIGSWSSPLSKIRVTSFLKRCFATVLNFHLKIIVSWNLTKFNLFLQIFKTLFHIFFILFDIRILISYSIVSKPSAQHTHLQRFVMFPFALWFWDLKMERGRVVGQCNF